MVGSVDGPVTHPYSNAAPHRLWRTAVSMCGADADPVTPLPFRIGPNDRVMTAGSCFAQHISGRLRDSGFAFLVTEPGHPLLPPAVADAHHYGRFTARYGNVYTARQLLQLFRRAMGGFVPADSAWQEKDGRWIDALRPLIQPGGFVSREELERDRSQHLAAVREAFETLNVFIFTLGLTESWLAVADGTAYPVCPGTAAGRFDPARYRFHNQEPSEVIADLGEFILALREINPSARVILTVSPVPLVATAGDHHVLQATTYSKSVLRVAADAIARRFESVAYFPSYEIITGPQSRGRYFADDLRSITKEGVDRVMGLFFAHATCGGAPMSSKVGATDRFTERSRRAIDLLCEEESLDDSR